ncbi:FmdB family transcriptional regulator [Bordetella genomosp. 9]|uniref:FmdB family transcriptional regulator n=1 Tax=Bordetella genomosp. 9 TaxID=1416803 RepID=A0A261R7I6_9BORD|nr:FmdB family zinc ribbon protein [Bordetella genomosp. 9]OZI20949.1 FmdB family transcriptional regulator [Bordetella genomosp. 9]
MPIYAYKCSSCGHAKDVLQKISDAPLTVCPECGASTFSKQVTAAGFQLKGSGWYVTDFRNNNSGGSAAASSGGAKTDAKADAKGDTSADGGGAKPADAAPAAPAAAPAAPSTSAT